MRYVIVLLVLFCAMRCWAGEFYERANERARDFGRAMQQPILDAGPQRQNNPSVKVQDDSRILSEQELLAVDCKSLPSRGWHFSKDTQVVPHNLYLPVGLVKGQVVRVSPSYVWLAVDLKWLQHRGGWELSVLDFGKERARVVVAHRNQLPIAEQKLIWTWATAALNKEPDRKQRWPANALTAPTR